jgi:hypothetical protein
LRTAERDAFEAIRYLECAPEIVAERCPDTLISVEAYRGRYRLLEDGKTIGEVIDTRSLVDFLHARLFSYALRERPRSGIVHAALLRRQGQRILIAGSRGAGKTTLTLRLVQSGYEMEGDEHVFIDPDGVIARPRACRVKNTSLPLLPDLAPIIAAAPSYQDVQGRLIFNLEPTAIGSPWRIEKGSVDCVIILRPNHGGYSSIRSIPPMMAAQALLSEIGMRDLDRGASIGAVAALVGRARTFDLSLGDHQSAATCIARVLDDAR